MYNHFVNQENDHPVKTKNTNLSFLINFLKLKNVLINRIYIYYKNLVQNYENEDVFRIHKYRTYIVSYFFF